MNNVWQAHPSQSKRALTYCFIYLFPVLVVLGFYLTGVFNYLTLFAGYILVPIGDLVIGSSDKNLAKDDEKVATQAAIYRYLTYAAAPIIVALVIWSCWVVSTQSLLWYEYVGFVLSVALVSGGIGLTVAHEQCHKLNTMDLFLARMTLMCTCYMHFMIEHVYGHHARVATKDDPATARLGQNLYQFYFRSVFGGYVSAWKIELNRLKKRRLGFWTLRNQMLWYTIVPLLFMSFITAAFGMAGLLFFILQAIAGFSYLEVINYIEHYGLERRMTAQGTYEKVKPFHSWNSDHVLSNYLLFGLPRHSDHHAHALRKYQILRSMAGAPQLPFGYPMMLPIAFFPSLWRRIMDPRVAEARLLLSRQALDE